MQHVQLYIYTSIRGLVFAFWPNPDWWFYWDNKVLATRKAMLNADV